jgi:hypothetical protein
MGLFPFTRFIMTNIDKVSAALSEWLFNVAASVLPKFKIPTESPIGKFMYGILGVNPSSYNIWKELGFLAEPTIQVMVTPMINKLLGSVPDEQVKDIAEKYVDALITHANEKGSVNVFGVELGTNAFEGLKDILASKFSKK